MTIQREIYTCVKCKARYVVLNGSGVPESFCDDAQLCELRAENEQLKEKHLKDEFEAMTALHDAKFRDWLLAEAKVDALRATIQAAIGVIDNWKVPLLDPDGKDSSEAVMRLLADDLRKVMGDE